MYDMYVYTEIEESFHGLKMISLRGKHHWREAVDRSDVNVASTRREQLNNLYMTETSSVMYGTYTY